MLLLKQNTTDASCVDGKTKLTKKIRILWKKKLLLE